MKKLKYLLAIALFPVGALANANQVNINVQYKDNPNSQVAASTFSDTKDDNKPSNVSLDLPSDILAHVQKNYPDNQKLQMEVGAMMLANRYANENPEVSYAIPSNITFKKNGTEIDVTRWNDQTNFHNNVAGGLRMPGAWEYMSNEDLDPSSVQGVAVLDSGLAANAPIDIKSRTMDGGAMLTCPNNDPYDYLEPCTGVGVSEVVKDEDKNLWHGTTVSSVIASNGPTLTGAAGKNAVNVLPVGVFPDGDNAPSELISAALDWLAGKNPLGAFPEPVPSNVNVVNMSLGIPKSADITDGDWKNFYIDSGLCQMYTDKIDTLTSQGKTVVIAAGNASSSINKSIPAGCPNVNAIVVQATTDAGSLANFSNFYNPEVCNDTNTETCWTVDSLVVNAPGSNVLALTSSDDTNTAKGVDDTIGIYGTSISAPQVAGIVSLLYTLYPADSATPMNYETVRAILKNAVGNQVTEGENILDANSIIKYALDNPPPLAPVTPSTNGDSSSDNTAIAVAAGVVAAAGATALGMLLF